VVGIEFQDNDQAVVVIKMTPGRSATHSTYIITTYRTVDGWHT
jgi:hypothetical protein